MTPTKLWNRRTHRIKNCPGRLGSETKPMFLNLVKQKVFLRCSIRAANKRSIDYGTCPSSVYSLFEEPT